MALVDLTPSAWNATSQTGTMTYQNGYSVDYTYTGSTDGISNGTFDTNGRNENGIETGAALGGSGGLATATVTFAEDVTNLRVALTDFDPGFDEEIGFIIDGVDVSLNDLIVSGAASVVGGVSPINGDGHVANLGADNTDTDVILVTFHQPLTSLTMVREHTVGASVMADIYLDNDPQFAPCFTAGTLIDTDRGLVPVETLKTGDMIRTKDHGFQPVKWVGASRVYASGFDVPLRIKKGTFGNARDLVVSKRHKMLMDHTHLSLMFDVEEAFACAMHLRNDDTIVREPEGWVTYYHVLLPQHEVIFAEGAATESFYPDEGTLAGMAAKTKEELLTHFAPETYGPPARPTFDPIRAMWIGRNLDILNGNDMGQIAAYENAMKAAE